MKFDNDNEEMNNEKDRRRSRWEKKSAFKTKRKRQNFNKDTRQSLDLFEEELEELWETEDQIESEESVKSLDNAATQE